VGSDLKKPSYFDKANAELAFIRTNEINVRIFKAKITQSG
jgi:hypothetical protein